MTIQERILQYLENKDITPYKFCKDLGFPMGYLNKRGVIGTDKYLKIIKYFKDLSPEWLLTGEGDMLKPRVEDIKNMTKEEQIKALKQIASGEFFKKSNIVPFYENVATIGGTQLSADLSPVTAPTAYIDLGSMFPSANAAIRHFGESMREYPNGCILAIKKLNHLKSIIWGQNYVVETDEIRVTKK